MRFTRGSIGRIAAVCALAAGIATGGAASGAPAADPATTSDASRALIVESIELRGATRTPRSTALLYFPLREGDALDAASLAAALESLRRADLFASVALSTDPGAERGRVRLALDVREKGAQLRVGTGYQDLSGWYLIPAQLALDNRLGRGERLRLQARIGYRVVGVELLYDEPRFGDGRNFWGASISGTGVERVYFVDGVEYEHRVGRGGIEAHVGRRFAREWRVEIGGGFETADADSAAEAREDEPLAGVRRGDSLRGDALPEGVSDDLGRRRRTFARAGLVHDSRAARRVAATPAAGLWGALVGEAVFAEDGTFGALTADARLFRAVRTTAFALRVRGGVVGDAAPFYDRFHLGGLYTVRGFPSQSLTRPEGSRAFASASLEMRVPLVGRADRPRLAGVVFVDAGVDERESAAAAGFGARLRVPWLDSIGLDLGVPLVDSPVGESFHANASLGWSF